MAERLRLLLEGGQEPLADPRPQWAPSTHMRMSSPTPGASVLSPPQPAGWPAMRAMRKAPVGGTSSSRPSCRVRPGSKGSSKRSPSSAK